MVALTIVLLSCFVAGNAAHLAPKDTELPAVTSMMNASSSTLGKISRHVAKISSHMNELISAQKTELALQKGDFEKQLKLQAEINSKLESQNEKTSAEIWDLEKNNDNLRDEAKTLQKQNANLRKAFAIVEAKVGAVDLFAMKVLNATDDEGSAELAVLNQKEGKDSDSDQDSDASDQEKKDGDVDQDSGSDVTKDADSAPAKDGESDLAPAKDGDSNEAAHDSDDASSFLAISSKTMRRRRDDDDDNSNDQQDGNAEDTGVQEDSSQNVTSDGVSSDPVPADNKSIDMVAELKNEINQLSKQQDSSRAQLVKLFQARFKKGENKKAQVLEKQKLLDSTKVSLTKLHSELQGAVKHLQGTKTKLENQLHGLGHYLAKLASYVNKPVADAEKVLPSLPSDVQTFLQSKA